ncbi:MAG TPA: diphthine--ammonia ligase [Anaerolineae bacterium]|nr:diphthine--ammonia ligase [Anaerolineae bacterium]
MISSIVDPIADRSFFCSWSGGKDSCLALYHALQRGGKPACLFTMLSEDNQTSRSHGLPKPILQQQARQLGLPIVFRSASWGDYEATFLTMLHDFKAQGVEIGVFGDIDIEEHRDWCQRVCAVSGLRAYHPLWKRPRRELLQELIDLKFKAVIVVTHADKLGSEWLGKTIDAQTIQELENAGVDPSGERGEYHTVVTHGPLLRSEITLNTRNPLLHDGYWFLPVLANQPDPDDE